MARRRDDQEKYDSELCKGPFTQNIFQVSPRDTQFLPRGAN
jgi:hypothetical protein